VLLALQVVAIPVWSQDVAARDSTLVIEINVPAFRLDVLADTQVIRSFDIAVGMRAYPTPIGDFAIAEVEWNPWWHPPDSPWAAKDTVTPPGPGNPMGKVKLPFSRLLFMHGTPLAQSIGRAASHACIRLRTADAIALARLVQTAGGALLQDAALDSLLERWQPSRRVALQYPIPVRIVYELVERRGDELVFHPDVYRRGRADVIARALVLISAAGYDTAQVNRDRLESIADRGAKARTSVKIAQLLPARAAERLVRASLSTAR
jgi:murein L,D-transpeptidase YcbB/YkuD